MSDETPNSWWHGFVEGSGWFVKAFGILIGAVASIRILVRHSGNGDWGKLIAFLSDAYHKAFYPTIEALWAPFEMIFHLSLPDTAKDAFTVYALVAAATARAYWKMPPENTWSRGARKIVAASVFPVTFIVNFRRQSVFDRLIKITKAEANELRQDGSVAKDLDAALATSLQSVEKLHASILKVRFFQSVVIIREIAFVVAASIVVIFVSIGAEKLGVT